MTDETKQKISLSKLKYKHKYCKEIMQYFYDAVNTREKGIIVKIPSYVGFALQIGVSVRTLQNWRNEWEDFKEACQWCDEILKEAIIGDCLGFKMHASFGKFLLSSRYGMKERVEITQDDSTVEVPKEVAELLAKRRERESREDDKK